MVAAWDHLHRNSPTGIFTAVTEYDASGRGCWGTRYPDGSVNGDTVGKVGTTGTALTYDRAGRLTSISGLIKSITYNALGPAAGDTLWQQRDHGQHL